jgi:hypothetical protein
MRHSLFIFLLLFYTHQLFSQKTSAKPWVNSSKDTEWIRNEDFTSRGKGIGKVMTLPEASGIAPSYSNSGCIWAHNDSGGSLCIKLIDTKDASIKSILNLNALTNIDWEDIECIQDQDTKKSYIYLADIGDNTGKRDFVTVYILLDEKMPVQKFLEANIYQTIHFTYPKKSRDAEAIMVDPLTKDIFIVSKRDKYARLYTIKYPYKTEGVDTALHIGTFPFNQITAGSISPDGMEILIRSYGRIFYWKREQGESISETLKRNPQLAPYYPIEPQGEAICWDILNGGYYTLSEKRRRQMPDPTLYFYQRVVK